MTEEIHTEIIEYMRPGAGVGGDAQACEIRCSGHGGAKIVKAGRDEGGARLSTADWEPQHRMTPGGDREREERKLGSTTASW